MGLKNCIENLESIVNKLKNSAQVSRDLWGDVADDLWSDMTDDETIKYIGRVIACLCIAISEKNESNAFRIVGALLFEIDKFFGAKDDEKTRQQIISSMGLLANGKRNKETGLNIILGALLLAEPHGRTREETNQTLLKIQKALEGVV